MPEMKTLKHDIEKVYEWLNEIEGRAGWLEPNHSKALAILRAVLQEIRDHIPINSLAHFSAQLPLVIKGMLFEGWNPEHNHIKQRKSEEFIAAVIERLPESYQYNDIDIEIDAVITTLANKIDYNEFEKLFKILPENIRKLFEYVIN